MILSKPVVAAVDFSVTSAEVIQQAARVAKVERVPLYVIHVVFPGLLPHRPGCRPSHAVIDDARLQAEATLSELVDSATLEIPTQLFVLVGRPPDEIGKFIDHVDAGLLVISANKPEQKRLSSIASRCVRTAHCDVWLVRKKKAEKLQHVLACLDLSEVSDHVLARAIEAARRGAVLDIVYVAYPTDHDPSLCGETTEIVSENRAFAEKSLKELVDQYSEELKDMDYQVTVLESPVPSVALTCHATDTEADLIVLGTRGHSKLGAMFFGTNAERMMHDTKAPVLAVRI